MGFEHVEFEIFMLHLGNVQEVPENSRSRENRSECHSYMIYR